MTAPTWVRGTLLLALTFVAGAAAGIGYERHFKARVTIMMDAGEMRHHLESQLDLDSTQSHQVATILQRHQGAMDSTWNAMRPHVHATLDSAFQEVLGVLRPDQRDKFRRLVGNWHPGVLR